MGLPGWLSGKESSCQCRRQRFNPRVWRTPWRRKWQPTPVFLLGKSREQRSLVGYSPWGHKESDMTEQLSARAHTRAHARVLLKLSSFPAGFLSLSSPQNTVSRWLDRTSKETNQLTDSSCVPGTVIGGWKKEKNKW